MNCETALLYFIIAVPKFIGIGFVSLVLPMTWDDIYYGIILGLFFELFVSVLVFLIGFYFAVLDLRFYRKIKDAEVDVETTW